MAPLAHTLALLTITVATVAIRVVPLDMARECFDDQYRGCGPAMTAALPAFNRSEFQKNPLFARVWVKAVAEWQSQGSRVSPLSSPDQAIALMAYTMPDVHKDFNAAVRAAGRSAQEYRKNFHFKTLHFLLAQALGTLRHTQNTQCCHVFRGVRDVHFKAQPGQRVRFGQFTSTSLSNKTAQRFGRGTRFGVHTCHGVDIQQFSNYPWEEEVLFPPFETFEVTEVAQDGCSTWIWLRSTGTFSKYNCEFQRTQPPFIPISRPHLAHILSPSVEWGCWEGAAFPNHMPHIPLEQVISDNPKFRLFGLCKRLCGDPFLL
uniref:NAD(P)(+)--arginine ADP-ribosyltransferase n=1 Tax=Cyanoderma ruficeps TaxID=181631 RepID=A0A8C3XAD9_9PASS